MKSETNIFSKTVIVFIYLLGLIIFLLMNNNICLAYIMPAEQILQFMSSNFSANKTFVTTGYIEENYYSSHTVQIYAKSPDLITHEIIGADSNSELYPDTDYLTLFLANRPSKIKQTLSMLDINVDSVEYSRVDGIIAYRIGGKGSVTPAILIEKERFLPLLIRYRDPDDPNGRIISIKFKDYRHVEKGWFPYKIIYSIDSYIPEIYLIQKIEPNISIDPSHFISKGTSRTPSLQTLKEKPDADGHLEQIIKTFEEKYN